MTTTGIYYIEHQDSAHIDVIKSDVQYLGYK